MFLVILFFKKAGLLNEKICFLASLVKAGKAVVIN